MNERTLEQLADVWKITDRRSKKDLVARVISLPIWNEIKIEFKQEKEIK